MTDTVRFVRAEAATGDLEDWKDEARTAIALELAAARLLAHCAMPVMPRFATRLAAGLGLDPPAQWPELVTLVPPETGVSLAREVFFGAQPAESQSEATPSPLLAWLSDGVREALLLPAGQPVAGATLVTLGTTSLQAIALQYQVLEHTGEDVSVEDLLGCRTVAQLAELIAAGEVPAR